MPSPMKGIWSICLKQFNVVAPSVVGRLIILFYSSWYSFSDLLLLCAIMDFCPCTKQRYALDWNLIAVMSQIRGSR